MISDIQNSTILTSTKTILKKIDDIEKDLFTRYDDIKSIATFTGASGALIFYYMLDKLIPDKGYKGKFYTILDDIYERLNSEEYPKTYCDGLAGVAFNLEFLRQKKMIDDEDICEALELFDEIILEIVKDSNTDLEEYDLLHGVIGGLYYLNERIPNHPNLQFDIIKQFETVANTLLEDINAPLKESDEIPQLNCGLAHGNMSYIIVFSKFLQNFPENKTVKKALLAIVNHQLHFKSSAPGNLSLFPTIAIKSEFNLYQNVLGWCYGDQVIAIGLKMAGTVLESKDILKEAKDIAYHTAKRNTVVLSSLTEVTDAGLCHGVGAVAMNNKILYDWTKDDSFLDNYNYFIDKVLERGDHPATPSGFRRYFGDDKYEDVVSFLDGTIGIGVLLISELLEEDVEWEKFFLLK